jgi:hypothetical protein
MRKTLLSLTALLAVALSLPAQAQRGPHPRRLEVNRRLGNQNRRIREEVREGDLTHQQATGLHRQDRQVRQEERDMTSQNGGHLTRQEQRTLNQQENRISHRIGQ